MTDKLDYSAKSGEENINQVDIEKERSKWIDADSKAKLDQSDTTKEFLSESSEKGIFGRLSSAISSRVKNLTGNKVLTTEDID